MAGCHPRPPTGVVGGKSGGAVATPFWVFGFFFFVFLKKNYLLVFIILYIYFFNIYTFFLIKNDMCCHIIDANVVHNGIR
jgi:hypothetical protein